MNRDWPNYPDNELARIARNQPEAFGILYDRYVRIVFRYCQRRLNDVHDAEDVTSAIFLRVCERIDTFRDGSFPAWLFSIARSMVIDTHRQKSRAPNNDGDVDRVSHADPELLAIDEDTGGILEPLLRLLTEEQREVIELRLAGLNGNQIALVLGKTLPSVKMLQLRAVIRMRTAAGEAGLIDP